MKKKTVKTAAPAKKEESSNESDIKEVKAQVEDKSEDEKVVSNNAPNPVVIVSKPASGNTQSKELNHSFLDLFWKLADNNASTRLSASLQVIQHIEIASSSNSKLNYTIGRLVQGLASNRECARHGYYITLVGILKSVNTTQLTNQIVHDIIKNKLEIEGGKRERIDQHVGQVLAYGALLKSGRLTDKEEMLPVINQLIIGSKIKNYIQPVAFRFLEELCQQVDVETFKEIVWPALKPELSLSWKNQTFDTFNLLLVVHNKFPKVVGKRFWKEVLGSSSITDPECFSELTTLILTHPSTGDHPLFTDIANSLFGSGKLLEFWSRHFEPALEPPTKLKSANAMKMLTSFLKIVDDETAGKMLLKNMVSVLVISLQAKEDSNFALAESTLEAIKTVLTKDTISPEAQSLILENLLNNSESVAFDKITNTRFMLTVSSVLKKETIVNIGDIYRRFVTESHRTNHKISLINHLIKLMSQPVMSHEVDWKASQLVFIAQCSYFTPTASKIFTSAVKDTFHRALDHPCKKLEDLSTLLFKTFEQVSQLVPDSDIPDEVKVVWNSLLKCVLKIQKTQKKKRSSKQDDSWTDKVFLVLYINMGFELLRQPAVSSEIIAELDTCYLKATEKETNKSKGADELGTDPHWLEVVTDILLSLLSRNQHLLRSVVTSVWSLVAEHITLNALHQVLDVIDPSKKGTPLVNADKDVESDLSDEEESLEEEEEEEQKEVGEEAEEEEEEEDDGEDELSDEEEEEETITDKLRMKIHEALGDGAALTDTESVDIDDLSDGQMKSLDKALGSAFQEFRKARPVRKNVNKLPKESTALMHFRLRCLDLIEVLTDKTLSISLSTAAMIPLLSLLEVTAKEPLQRPLMMRTRSVLRKLANIRQFTESKDVQMEDLVKLLQILFHKPYTKKNLTPYISEDLVQCSSFILRCTLHLSRVNGSAIDTSGVYQLYHTNLCKFFLKRDSPFPFNVFHRALVYPWPDAGLLAESLIEYAFGPTILKNRKFLAVRLLTVLFRNPSALSAMGQPLLTKRLHKVLQCSQRVVEEADRDFKPRYLNELFIMLRIVLLCPEVAELKDCSASGTAGTVDAQLWKPLKAALTAFAAKGLSVQKDLRKSYMALARQMGLDITITAAAAGELSTKTKSSSSLKKRKDHTAAKSPMTNGSQAAAEKTDDDSVVATTKKSKSNRPGAKEKKESKKRRMTASAEGFTDVTFAQVDIDSDAELEENDKTEPLVAQEVVGDRRKLRSAAKKAMETGNQDTNGNQVESVNAEVHDKSSKKKKKNSKKAKNESLEEEETLSAPADEGSVETNEKTGKISKKKHPPTVETTTDDRRNKITETPSPAKKKKKSKSTIN